MTAIVWFRQNLRLRDNPPLHRAASESERGILPVYLLDTSLQQTKPIGGAGRWALHQALESLNHSLENEYGQTLYVEATDDPAETLARIAKSVGADTVYTETRWEPGATELEATVEKRLFDEAGCNFVKENASLLQPAWDGCKDDGDPYMVYTPYWRKQSAFLKENLREVYPKPSRLPQIPDLPKKYGEFHLGSLHLMPEVNWYQGMAEFWELNERAGWQRIEAFLDGYATSYGELRNLPATPGTSFMSPYMHWGIVSVVELYHAVREKARRSQKPAHVDNLKTYIAELGWREFCHHILYHYPKIIEHPLKEKYADFPFQPDKTLLTAWQKGRTGYPIVDAGMRQLWHMGWMHNRLRMITGSLLVKHLLQPWQAGEAWFWDCLIGADAANNVCGWQWVAGCGADASPYFRIFNPMTQGEKFDKNGEYIRQWVPELKDVPTKFIHTPWEMDRAMQKRCGVIIGEDYPAPIVEHKAGRTRALEAFEAVKN